MGRGLLQAFLGCVAVYGVLLATGAMLYGQTTKGALLIVLALLSAAAVIAIHRKA